MSETLDQIALRIKGEAYPDWNVNIDRYLVEFATRIKEELCKGQEPVTQVMGVNSVGDCVISGTFPTGTKLYLHPTSIPADMVMVPREPTKAMLSAMRVAHDDPYLWTWAKTYKAMIAAYEGEKK